ncbi:MAG: hypothetical protein ACTSO7_07340 [Candidatus Heimdallarchaeota archaeon]
MVFRKKGSAKKGMKNTKRAFLLSSKILPDILQATSTIDAPILIQDNQIKILVDFFTSTNKILASYLEYYEAESLIKLRGRQLEETKKVVYSLRETDQTSKEAMDFLKVKLTTLSTERDNLAMQFLTFRESINKITDKQEIIDQTLEFISEINFVDTKRWEKDLDYFRTRFLLQREQTEADQELKDQFVPDEENIPEITLADLKKQDEFTRDKIVIEYSRKQKDKIDSLLKEYNDLSKDFPPKIENELAGYDFQTIRIKVKSHEEEAFDVGKELYTLKREQGILTLKTYEIIQTIRSRLLNITGSIASRRFLRDAFKELQEITNSENLSPEVMKDEILHRITRLLRIIGEIAPNEY